MTDFAVWPIHADRFGSAENFLVVLDRLSGPLDDQIGRDGVVTLRDIRDFAHEFLLQSTGLKVSGLFYTEVQSAQTVSPMRTQGPDPLKSQFSLLSTPAKYAHGSIGMQRQRTTA